MGCFNCYFDKLLLQLGFSNNSGETEGVFWRSVDPFTPYLSLVVSGTDVQ